MCAFPSVMLFLEVALFPSITDCRIRIIYFGLNFTSKSWYFKNILLLHTSRLSYVLPTTVSSLEGCVLTTGVCPHYRGVSSLQGCVLSLQGCVLTTGVCPHYRGVFSHYRGVSSLQGCVFPRGVCPHYRGVSSRQGCVLTTGVCPHYRGVS